MNINSFTRKLLIVFILILFCSSNSYAFDKIEKIAYQALNDNLSQGIVILIRQGDKDVFYQAFGSAEKDSIFDVASLTKIYATTLSIMKLTDTGVLSPSDKLKKFFPELNADKAEITIEQLLRHTSGLPAWEAFYCEPNDLITEINLMPLSGKPGAKRVYSDIGFILLGKIIEETTSKSLDQFSAENFYIPMGLSNTGFKPTRKTMPTYFSEYEELMINNKKCPPLKREFLNGIVNDGNARLYFGGVAGHAGLFSNAEELFLLTQLIAKNGIFKNQQYISKKTIDLFLNKDAFAQGMGFALSAESLNLEEVTPKTFGHLGFTGVSAVYVPEKMLTVIILTNRQMAGLDKNGKYPNLKNFRNAIFLEAIRLAN